MNYLRDLLNEYDRLGDTSFSSAHDFTLRQRKLETWAAKARDAIAELVNAPDRSGGDGGGPAPALERSGT